MFKVATLGGLSTTLVGSVNVANECDGNKDKNDRETYQLASLLEEPSFG